MYFTVGFPVKMEATNSEREEMLSFWCLLHWTSTEDGFFFLQVLREEIIVANKQSPSHDFRQHVRMHMLDCSHSRFCFICIVAYCDLHKRFPCTDRKTSRLKWQSPACRQLHFIQRAMQNASYSFAVCHFRTATYTCHSTDTPGR